MAGELILASEALMSYLSPGFDTDVFISYTHFDNKPRTGDPNGWIDKFQDEFEKRLRQMLGAEVGVYRDRKLRGNDDFEDELRAKVQGSAILVSIVSPRYTNSESCLKELTAFCQAAEAGCGLRLGNQTRIFKVIKTPFPSEREPLQIRKLLGYKFYELDPQTETPREFDPVLGQEALRRFLTLVDDVAWHVDKLLEGLRTGGAPVKTRLAPSSGATVYLAETTRDLEPKRDEIKRELEQHGHRVLPDQGLLWNEPECLKVVRAQLAQAQLSVHLVGAKYGAIPEGERSEGERRSIVSWQYRLAMERAGACSRLVWMPPGLESSDERQRKVIEYLRTDPQAQEGADLLQEDLEELKTVIRDTLDRQRRLAAQPVREPATDDAPGPVYLICDQQDRAAVAPLEDYLYKQGCDLILPAFEGEENTVRKDHTENLVTCRAVLIYCGGTGEHWLREQMRDLRKARGYGRTLPMEATIYLGSPDMAWKQGFRNHQPPVIKNFTDFTPESLAPFLSRLR
jgi:hypothetical protein